jgi:hypothetical protein
MRWHCDKKGRRSRKLKTRKGGCEKAFLHVRSRFGGLQSPSRPKRRDVLSWRPTLDYVADEASSSQEGIMKRVDIKKALKDEKKKAEMILGVVNFLCALEGHNHKPGNINETELQPGTKEI